MSRRAVRFEFVRCAIRRSASHCLRVHRSVGRAVGGRCDAVRRTVCAHRGRSDAIAPSRRRDTRRRRARCRRRARARARRRRDASRSRSSSRSSRARSRAGAARTRRPRRASSLVAPDALARRVDRARRERRDGVDARRATRSRLTAARVAGGARRVLRRVGGATVLRGRRRLRVVLRGTRREPRVRDGGLQRERVRERRLGADGRRLGGDPRVEGFHARQVSKPRACLANGEFYDAETGAATALTREIRARLERYDARAAAREQRARMFPDCDSTSDGDFVDVRCREDDSGPRYPRNETTTDAEGRASSRCACYGDLGVSDARRAYPGCDLTSTRCRAPLGAGVG